MLEELSNQTTTDGTITQQSGTIGSQAKKIRWIYIMIMVVLALGAGGAYAYSKNLGGFFNTKSFSSENKTKIFDLDKGEKYISANPVNSTCHPPISSCAANDPSECAVKWIKSSNCLTDGYVSKYLSDVKAEQMPSESGPFYVRFNIKMNGELIHGMNNLISSGELLVAKTADDQYDIINVFAPLKEYNFKINRNQAFDIAKKDNFCGPAISKQADILNFVILKAEDEYYQKKFSFDPNGLIWEIPTEGKVVKGLDVKCYVDANSGLLIRMKSKHIKWI